MIPRSLLCALLVTCAAGCTNSTPTSTETVAPSPTSITDNDPIMGTVVITRHTDHGIDGTTDATYVQKTSYDRHGNAILVEEKSTGPGSPPSWVTRSSHDRWGNVLAQVIDRERGSLITRHWLATVETDEVGRPSRQVYLLDLDKDGAPDHEGNMLYYPAYDPYGRPLQKITDADNDGDGTLETRTTETMMYDGDGNIEKHTSNSDRGMDGSIEAGYWAKLTYNEHRTVVHVVSESFELSNGTGLLSTTTTQFDGAGNPTVQTTDVDYPSADGTVDVRYIVTTSYNEHHRPLNQVRDTDIDADGTIESRAVTTYDYFGTVAKPFGRSIPAVSSDVAAADLRHGSE